MASLPGFTHANSGTSYYALKSDISGAIATWSTFPAISTINASGYSITNASSLQIDDQVLTALSGELLLNGVPIATIPDISNVADWALYPAIGNVNVSNFAIQNASGITTTTLSAGSVNVNGLPVVTTPSTTDINLSGNNITNAASVQIGTRTLTTTAGTAAAPYLLLNGSNVLSNWSSFAAGSAVSLGLNDINNAKDIHAGGIVNAGSMNTTSSITISAQVLTTTPSALFLNGVQIASTTAPVDVSQWATYAAVTNVNMSGFAISNTPTISLSGNTQNVVLTASGTNLLVDGQPVFTGVLPPSDTSNWATYAAVTNVNMSGFALTSGSSNGLDLSLGGRDVYIQTGGAGSCNCYIKGNVESGSITCKGVISQSNAGSGCNFFQSAVQVGVNGILPTDKLGQVIVYGVNTPALTSALYVQGGTTLDGGGTVHGITIGTQPVAGINTVRIDVLPVGMLLTSPTFITMNGLGAANIAMGGAVAIGAGSYVTLEHGAGLGQNGIFLQNTARDGQCKVIMTGGGTFYNATSVQSSNIINPNGVQFWNGVYNPSGGSAPIAPLNFGRAVVDISSAGAYLANLTSGNLPSSKNSNSVFIGNFPNLTTAAASSTIAIGDMSGMVGQSNYAIAIGSNAGNSNQGSSAVAVGSASGYANQGADAVAVGLNAGFSSQGPNAVAIGNVAGNSGQGGSAVAIGNTAANVNQGSSAVAIGQLAGTTGQGSSAVAVGALAGNTTQGLHCVAVGFLAGSTGQTSNAVAIGNSAGQSNQLGGSVAIGHTAGQVGQGAACVAVGSNAGVTAQGFGGVAVGAESGSNNQGVYSVAVGTFAANTSQGYSSVALGFNSGRYSQGDSAIAIGSYAGHINQGIDSIAIGNSTGYSFTGQNSVVIGRVAVTAQSNTIVLNATGALLDGITPNSTYIAPMRAVQDSNAYQNSLATYNTTTAEVGYMANAYNFVVHATTSAAYPLTPSMRGRTIALTGSTSPQPFNTTALGANDAGFFVIVHNSSGLNGGDYSLTATPGSLAGVNIIHEQKPNFNGGSVYLYWNGTTLRGY